MDNHRQGIFDVVKFILALMVVAIHVRLFPMVLFPWLRLAVPLFFVISSYLFFSKQNTMELFEQKQVHLKKYILRNIRLYSFWLVVLLPHALYLWHWFDEGFFLGCLKFIRSLLFGSTFAASWFLQALIVGVCIVFFISRKFDNRRLLLISMMIYTFAVIKSSYLGVIQSEWVQRLYCCYEILFLEPMLNATSALVWIAIGKCFADGTFGINRSVSCLGLILSCFLLYAEWRYVGYTNGTYDNDCYFFLIPTVIFAFNLIKALHIKSSATTFFMGQASIIIYTSHMPVRTVLTFVLNKAFGIRNSLLIYVMVVGSCLLESALVFRLEKTRFFRWIRYAH